MDNNLKQKLPYRYRFIYFKLRPTIKQINNKTRHVIEGIKYHLIQDHLSNISFEENEELGIIELQFYKSTIL